MFKGIAKYWKDHPKFRALARQAGVAGAAYVVSAVKSGHPWTFTNLIYGAATAAVTTVLGAAGLEPFLGLKAKVVVPADQTVQK